MLHFEESESIDLGGGKELQVELIVYDMDGKEFDEFDAERAILRFARAIRSAYEE
jgi:hypothetical protein